MANNEEVKKQTMDPVNDNDRVDDNLADASVVPGSNEGDEGSNTTNAASKATDSATALGKGEEPNGTSSQAVETDKCVKEENVQKTSENGAGAAKAVRPSGQPTKRRPDKELTHDNWDIEDEPEEKGEFIKASEDQLKDRKILTARRKKTNQSTGNPFGAINLASSGFGGFGSSAASSGNIASMFNFGSSGQSKFDFGLPSTGKTEDKKESSESETTSSSKKIRRDEPDPSADPGTVNSATTE